MKAWGIWAFEQHPASIGSKDPDQWHMEWDMEYHSWCQKFVGKSLKMMERLGQKRNAIFQCNRWRRKSTVAKLIRVITYTKQMSWYSRILESKGSLGLVGSNASGNLDYIVIKLSTNMIEVAKDKSFLRVESTGNDILCVLACKLSAFLDSQGRLEQVLFIICSHKKSESLAYMCVCDRWNMWFLSLPVSWMTSGTSKTSCNHWQNTNGTRWPRCMEELEGPRPVYRKKGFFCS